MAVLTSQVGESLQVGLAQLEAPQVELLQMGQTAKCPDALLVDAGAEPHVQHLQASHPQNSLQASISHPPAVPDAQAL